MLYLWAEYMQFEGLFNLVRYQTFRAGATIMTALVIGLVIGPRMIDMLRVRQGKGQPIREDGPQTHLAKRGTPTMGGLMILVSLLAASLIWMDLRNPFVWACIAVTVGFGAIGFYDDYLKVTRQSHKGFSGRSRLLIEALIALVAGLCIFVRRHRRFRYGATGAHHGGPKSSAGGSSSPYTFGTGNGPWSPNSAYSGGRPRGSRRPPRTTIGQPWDIMRRLRAHSPSMDGTIFSVARAAGA